MTIRTYVECDGPRCTERVGSMSRGHGTWYRLDRHHPFLFEEVGESDRFDFCSLPCVGAWASNRELIRNAS